MPTWAECSVFSLWHWLWCFLAFSLWNNRLRWKVLMDFRQHPSVHRKTEQKGGVGDGEDEGSRGWRRGRKGTVFHSPSNVLSVKTSRLSFTALHSTAPQPLRLMAVLADHNTTPLFWQGQIGSKRILAFNQTIRDATECWLVFIKRWVLFWGIKGTFLITMSVCEIAFQFDIWKSLELVEQFGAVMVSKVLWWF